MIRPCTVFVATSLLLPTAAIADSWTSGQEDWARHGFRHGAWDCYGNCSGGRPAPARTAKTTVRMQLTCQQDLSDGRTLVSNGNTLPANASFRVLSYRPMQQDSGWSRGPCLVAVTR